MTTVQVYSLTRGRGTCRGCGAPIVWAQVVSTGKKMPFNPPATALSTLTDAADRRIDVVELDSHFATCPKADTFRKQRGGRP
jgi:hypothetical protein